MLDIIVNLQACGGKAAQRWEVFEVTARRVGINFKAHFTEYAGHAILLARQLLSSQSHRITVFGGDGTLNEVLNGIIEKDRLINPNTEVVFIGAGSSCDVVKMFLQVLPPLDRLTATASHLVDVVRLDCQDTRGKPVTRYFLVNSSVGIISRSIELFNKNTPLQGWLKRRNIDAAALYAGLKNIATFGNMQCTLQLPPQAAFQTELKNVTIFKSAYFGGGMNYGVASRADDGLLHIALIHGCSRWRTLFLLPALYDGTILNKPEAAYHQTTEFYFSVNNKPVCVEADGEIIGYPPCHYRLLPRFLRLVI